MVKAASAGTVGERVEHMGIPHRRSWMGRLSKGARAIGRPVAAFCIGLLLTVCDDDGDRLEPVKGCSSHDDCTDADPRYDRCAYVCEGQVTYCIVSCETAADCQGRGLPSDWTHCDIPRPGDGFCNSYNHDFTEDACKEVVPEIPD
jgi:hypothetical protein